MKLTKQDLMRLPKERLAEIIVEMQEKEMTLIPTPSITPESPSIYTKPCVYAPNGKCDYCGGCWLCPYKQTSATIFKAEDIQKYVDATVGGKNTSATDGKEHPNSFVE